TAFAACAVQAASQTAPAPAVSTAATPKPQYGTFGFDTTGMDRSVVPGDNFYQFANGIWAKNTAIPADKSNYGMFTVLHDLSPDRTRQTIEEQAKDPNSKIGNAYASFLDTGALETKGLAPFEPWLKEIRSIQSKNDLAALYSHADRLGIGIPFNMFIGQDRK